MERYYNTVQTPRGPVVNNASITVYEADGVTKAAIYSTDGVTPLGNPFLSGYARGEGELEFAAANGQYDIEIVNGAETDWIRGISLFALPLTIADVDGAGDAAGKNVGTTSEAVAAGDAPAAAIDAHEAAEDVHTLAAISDVDSASAHHGDALVYDAFSGTWRPRAATALQNDIGIMGSQAAGVGIYPGDLPAGFAEMPGTIDPAADNYGNYQYSDGSIMCWAPLFYYRIGHVDSPNYAAHGLNAIDIASESDYAAFAPYVTPEAKANADGYALHRAFKDGGATKRGFFIDKYQASNNAGTASSIKNGLPLSTNSAHNQLSDLTGSPSNNYAGTFAAAKTRGAVFAVCSRFIYSALALLSVAHGQAATSSTYCEWYDGAGITNFPKGCNNNALGDTNDGAVSYTSDGYLNCGQTGSGLPFAKTTHNGQACGVADLNGNMWEVSSGLTRPGTSNTDTTAQDDATAFYVLKESVAIADLEGGFGTALDAWGDATHLATLYDPITLAHIGAADGWQRFGNAANQVLSEAISGDSYLMTGLGIYKDANAESPGGTNLFGGDGVYEYHRANLCVLSGGYWSYGSNAGPWAAYLSDSRSHSYHAVGFRAACYFD